MKVEMCAISVGLLVVLSGCVSDPSSFCCSPTEAPCSATIVKGDAVIASWSSMVAQNGMGAWGRYERVNFLNRELPEQGTS